jgi:hypothetical protein
MNVVIFGLGLGLMILDLVFLTGIPWVFWIVCVFALYLMIVSFGVNPVDSVADFVGDLFDGD